MGDVIMRLEEMVSDNYKQLSTNDLHIWKYISTHKKECEYYSIDELASRCNVSRTTILRFSKRIGLKGYGELKVYLRLDNQMYKTSATSFDVVYQTYQEYMKEIRDKDFTKVIKMIDEANNLYVYGTGVIQNNVAKELKRSFLMINKLFFNISSSKETEAFVKIINNQDAIIIISYSGENKLMLDFVKSLKMKNVPIISITTNKENQLAHLANESLYVEVPNIINPLGARYEGLVNYFTLIDFLTIRSMEYLQKRGNNNDIRKID